MELHQNIAPQFNQAKSNNNFNSGGNETDNTAVTMNGSNNPTPSV